MGDEFHRALADATGERRIGAEEELLAGLAAGVKSAGDLGTAERTVGEQAAVFAGERHAEGGTLVNDVDRHLGKTMDVGLTGAVVAALDGVIEKPIHTVAVILIVFGGVDATLRGNRVGTTRRIVENDTGNLVAKVGERGGGGGAG